MSQQLVSFKNSHETELGSDQKRTLQTLINNFACLEETIKKTLGNKADEIEIAGFRYL